MLAWTKHPKPKIHPKICRSIGIVISRFSWCGGIWNRRPSQVVETAQKFSKKWFLLGFGSLSLVTLLSQISLSWMTLDAPQQNNWWLTGDWNHLAPQLKKTWCFPESTGQAHFQIIERLSEIQTIQRFGIRGTPFLRAGNLQCWHLRPPADFTEHRMSWNSNVAVWSFRVMPLAARSRPWEVGHMVCLDWLKGNFRRKKGENPNKLVLHLEETMVFTIKFAIIGPNNQFDGKNHGFLEMFPGRPIQTDHGHFPHVFGSQNTFL